MASALRRPSLFRWPIVAVAMLLVAALGGAALAQSTAQNLDLVGPVAAVTEYQTYEPESEDPRLRNEWTFGPDGLVTSRVFYSYSFMDGSLNYRQESTYDADGFLLESVNVAPDGSAVGRTTYDYDEEGRRTGMTTLDENGVELRRLEWTYDGSGNLVELVTYRDGELASRDEYEYDGEGRRIAGREYDEDGVLTSETTYRVPDSEYETLEYEDGEVEERIVWVDGEHGVVSVESYTPDDTLQYGTYFSYDENGLRVERRDVTTYEVMGNVETDDSTTVYEYEFDDVGNWVRMTALEDRGSGPTPIELQTREIAYR